MNGKISSVLIGAMFIVFGAIILLNKMDVFNFSWDEGVPLFLIALSVLSFISVFQGNKGNAFWGTVLGLLGVFFFLRNYGIIGYFWFDEIWPVILIALGLGFIVTFFFNPRDWGVLIPGGILTFLGTVFLMETLHVSHHTRKLVHEFWPLILVLIGIGLISNSISKKK